MKFIQGDNRNQINLFPVSLDQSIDPDNEVRIIDRASGEVGFMFIAYNLRRIGNILTRDRLMEYLRILVLLFLNKTDLSRLKNSLFKPTFFLLSIRNRKFPDSLVSA